METIYNYKGKFPFNEQRIPNNTFIQVAQQYESESAIQIAKAKLVSFKKMDSKYIMRLVRILKEETKLYAIFQYFNTALEDYIKTLKDQKQLLRVMASVTECFKDLVRARIKTDLYLDSIGVDQHQVFKAFVHPSYEIIEDSEQLIQFYQAEQKRLHVEIQEIYEFIHGKSKQKIVDKVPNFCIIGNTLIFSKDMDKKTPLPVETKLSPQKHPQKKDHRSHQNNSIEENKRLSQVKQSSRQQSLKNEACHNKHAQTILKSRQMIKSIQNQLSCSGKKSNPQQTPRESERSHQNETRETRQSFQRSQQHVHQHQNQERSNSTNGQENNTNDQNTSENKGGPKKMKMRITTCHQIEVEAADVDRIRQQILYGETHFLPNSLTQGAKVEEFTEPQMTSSTGSQHQKNVAQRMRLAKEKADAIKQNILKKHH